MTQYIDHSRFNQIRSSMLQVMGEGAGNFGYGQTNLQSAAALENSLITAEQMNKLRLDVLRMRQHQLGVDRSNLLPFDPEYLKLVVGTGPINDRDFIAEQHFASLNTNTVSAIADRFKIGGDPTGNLEFTLETSTSSPNGPGTQGGIRSERNQQWSSNLVHSVRIQFRNGKDARHFFNAGGELRITPSISNGNNDLKYQKWQTLLNTFVGTVRIGHNYTVNTGSGGGGLANVGFYQLNTSARQLYIKSSDGVYQQNNFTIFARCDSTNNNPSDPSYLVDRASTISLDIQFNDDATTTTAVQVDPITGVSYVVANPDEPITGRLVSEVSQRRPTGLNVLVHGPSAYFNDAVIS